MDILSTRLSTATTIAANGLVPIGAITHRKGCRINANDKEWIIEGAGHYVVNASITVAPTTAGAVTVTMKDNGITVATAKAVTATNGDAITLPLLTTVYRKCNCSSDKITIEVSAASSVSEMDVVVRGDNA